MSISPRKYLVAAIALAASFATVPMILGAHVASADAPLHVSGRYGCASSGNFVEVSILNPTPDTDYEVGILPAGQTAPSATPSADTAPASLTTPDSEKVTVRLAQSISTGDNAYVLIVATGAFQVVDLPNTCRELDPTVPRLPAPGVAVNLAAPQECIARPVPSDKVAISAKVQVYDDPTRQYKRASGLDDVFYNLALVDTKANKVVDSDSVKFSSADSGGSCLAAPAGNGTYQVRAIGTDGSVTRSTNKVNVKAPTPTPSPRPRPTPTKTTPSPGKSPTPVTSPSAPSSATVQPPASSTAALPGGGFSQIALPPGSSAVTSSSPNGVSSSAGSAGPGTSSSTRTQPHPVNSSNAPQPVPNSSGQEALKRLAEPPLDSSSKIFVWQRDAALIVLIDALAIGALVGGVVWSAKRR